MAVNFSFFTLWEIREIYSQTVWKFHNFAITQILREINFWDSKSAKLAILTHLEALKFEFYLFLYFLKAANDQISKIQGP